MNVLKVAGLLGLFAFAAVAQAQTAPAKRGGEARGTEANVSLHSTITGNQEQPKVLYIVPWQGPGGADNLDTGLQPIVSDVFAPIDRREFQRELKYREMMLDDQSGSE